MEKVCGKKKRKYASVTLFIQQDVNTLTIIIQLIVITLAFIIVRGIQTLISRLAIDNDKNVFKTRKVIQGIYTDYEQAFGIEKMPLNILRGVSIRLQLKNKKVRDELLEMLEKVFFYFSPSMLKFLTKRIFVILIHSATIITITITTYGPQTKYLALVMIGFSVVYSIYSRHGRARIIFTTIIFAYIGYFLPYTTVYYIVISRIFRRGLLF